MKLEKIIKAIEDFAPLSVSENYVKKYNGYDNSGLILKLSEEITGVVFALDLSVNAIEFAKRKGANLIVTHHPAIFAKINKIGEGATATLTKAIKAGISIYSGHLNFDMVKGGIDDYLASIFTQGKTESLLSFENGSYGKIYENELTILKLIEKFKKVTGSNKILVYGDENFVPKRVASFCGAGVDDEVLDALNGVDLVISADIKHHLISRMLDENKSVLCLTHYASEVFGFKNAWEKIKDKLEIESSFFMEENKI